LEEVLRASARVRGRRWKGFGQIGRLERVIVPGGGGPTYPTKI